LAQLIRLDEAVKPKHYRLSLRIDPNAEYFFGKVEIDVQLGTATRSAVLHAQNLIFEKVELRSNSKIISAQVRSLDNDGTISVDTSETIGPGPVTLSFSYRAPLSSGLEGIYKIVDEGQPAVFTQFEAIAARRAFPCFDEPGFKALFDIQLIVPSKFQAISNTLELDSVKDNEELVTHRFATTKPLPTYLIAFAIGKFDIVEVGPVPASKLRDTPIPLRGIAMRGKGEQLEIAMRYTAPLVLAEEEYFGIAYPYDKLDIIAVPDFGAGGMENAGAITYDENYVLMLEDAGIEERREFLSIHAHEIAHHWFGNLVSPKWWDDLWLNESFASFMETKFAHMIEPDWHFETDVMLGAHEAMLLDQIKSVRRIHEPVDSVDSISASFDEITYQKGAAILAMAENEMGEESFKNIVRSFLKDRLHGTMTTEDFLNVVEHKAGIAATRIVRKGISETGVPISDQTRFGHKPRYELASLSLRDGEANLVDFKSWERAQALAAAISLDVGLYSGRVDFDFYLRNVEKIAEHPDWQVAGFPLERLNYFADAVGPITSAVEEALNTVYAMQLKDIDLLSHLEGDTVASWQKLLKREDLVMAFAKSGADPARQLQFAELGMRLAERKRISLHENNIAPYDVAKGALVAAAVLYGDDFLNLALAQLRNKLSLADREVWLDSIAASHADRSSEIIAKLLLSEELRNQEVPDLLYARADYKKFQHQLWDVVAQNSGPLLKRLDGDLDVTLIQLADVFATQALGMRVHSTITPLLGKLRGGAVQLQQTLETIQLNASLMSRAANALN
jgi:Peptidase family M1 domain/Peptidase M1 N-terminal domain